MGRKLLTFQRQLFVILLVLCQYCFAQPEPIKALIEEWASREQMFNEIMQAAPSPARSTSLRNLLEKENTVYNYYLDHPDKEKSVSSELGEDYTEYYSQLFDACLTAAEAGFPTIYPTLAQGSYEFGTQASERLLRKPDRIVFALLEDTQHSSKITRQKIADMLSAINAAKSDSLTDQQKDQVRVVLRQLATDSDPSVARVATAALEADQLTWRVWLTIGVVVLAMGAFVVVRLRISRRRK